MDIANLQIKADSKQVNTATKSLQGLEKQSKKTESGVKKLGNTTKRSSADFGILEKTSGLRLVPAQFTWDDIGNWASLERALPSDDQGNVAQGPHLALETSGCIICSRDETIATFGVSDLVVVQAHGKVLVCSKDKAADLKKLVSALGPKED